MATINHAEQSFDILSCTNECTHPIIRIRRYMAEILPIWRKTLSSQPINYSYLGTKATFGVLALPLLVTYVLKAYPMTSY